MSAGDEGLPFSSPSGEGLPCPSTASTRSTDCVCGEAIGEAKRGGAASEVNRLGTGYDRRLPRAGVRVREAEGLGGTIAADTRRDAAGTRGRVVARNGRVAEEGTLARAREDGGAGEEAEGRERLVIVTTEAKVNDLIS